MPDYLASLHGSRSTQRDALVAETEFESRSTTPSAPPAPAEKSMASKVANAAWSLSHLGAAGVSYARNRSIGEALLHGLLGPAYLAYVGYEAYAGDPTPTPALAGMPRAHTGRNYRSRDARR